YLMQFQSDIANVKVVRAKLLETTALGSAYLAGLAVGYWKDQEELKQLIEVGETFEPDMADDKRKALYEGWENAVDSTIIMLRNLKEEMSSGSSIISLK